MLIILKKIPGGNRTGDRQYSSQSSNDKTKRPINKALGSQSILTKINCSQLTPFKSIKHRHQYEGYNANPRRDVGHDTLRGVHLVEDVRETRVEQDGGRTVEHEQAGEHRHG